MVATSQNPKLFNDYDGFIEKFKPKLTTDDCYTPPLVYEAVADWVSRQYDLDRDCFCRPFYPGGDFENEDYTGKIVVDNPPFSILSKIVKWYVSNNVQFFLFSPTLTTIVSLSDVCTALPIGVNITYENGAVVTTSFCTNLEPHEIRMKTAPSLYESVKKADQESQKSTKATLPKYIYPPQLITSAQMYPLNKYGIELVIPRAESIRVSMLDSQKHNKKTIFGGGLLLSNRVTAVREKAEREKAEHEKAEQFPLSEREQKLIEMLSESSN